MKKIRRRRGDRRSQTRFVPGLVWYENEQDWRAIRDASSDSEVFDDSYQGWLALAERRLAELLEAGIETAKVYLTPDDFSEWCRARSKVADASARTQYVIDVLQEKWKGRKETCVVRRLPRIQRKRRV